MPIEKTISRIKTHYNKYLGKVSLDEYLTQSRLSKIWDEEKVTDSLFESLLKDKDLWNYSKDNVLLQQQQHKANINWRVTNLKPDFETNNEFCKTPILFDAKASNIPYGEMVSGINTVYEHTFKRYLENIKPFNKYIIGFNLEYIILYWKDSQQKIQVLAAIDIKKLFNNDIEEFNRFKKLLELTKFEELNNLEKIEKLENKVLDEDSIFNIEIFVKKFKNTQNWLYNFFLERLEQIGIDDIPDNIKDELVEFMDKPKDLYIQLANRLTLIEFFKYIFIRTYEDFQLIHKVWDDVIPVTFWEAIKNIKYIEWDFDDFREKYIRSINKTSFKEIWEEFFQWFSSLFRKYEFFIEEHILEWDSDEEEFDKEYRNRLFDIVFFLNEFYFGGLESEWDDIIGRLYETSLERADRKRFGQFYTPRYIIDFILDELKIEPASNKKIVDLSCWTGGFLMKYLSKIDWKMLIDEDDTLLKDIFKGTYGIDIKMFSTLLTKLNLALIFIIKNKFLIKRKLKPHKLETKNIITDDWLEINKEESKKLESWSFDYVVWNPPYVWMKWNADIFERIRTDNNLSQYFESKSDLYYFFIIHWIEKLKIWWKFGYIFPREWITADFASKLREYILENTKILKLIDLNWISIFEDAWTTSCLLFLEKVENKLENNNFDYIQFKKFEEKNIIKYIDTHSDWLQTRTTIDKKQKVLSGFEIFSSKIMIPSNFDRIVRIIKKWEKCDISMLKWLTTDKIKLNDFIDVKEMSQNKLSYKPWLFWSELPTNLNLSSIDGILAVSSWIMTWSDSIWNKHYENWYVTETQVWRWIFILKENLEIRWKWLRNKGQVEINLLENWGWIELNKKEKELIKPIFSWVSLNKWNLNKNSKWIIYLHFDSLKNYWWTDFDAEYIKEEYPNIYNYLSNVYRILKSRKSANFKPYFRRWNYLCFQNSVNFIPFNKEKILTNSKVLGFTFTEKSAYWTGWWVGGLNYIFVDDKNSYTKTIEKKSSRKNYLKFINAILNSGTIINYIKDNKFNSLSWTKLKELKIPKINFNDTEQVEKYNQIVKIADSLINIYSDTDSLIEDLVIKKEWLEVVENGSEEFNTIMNNRDFEIENDVLYIVKIWWIEYFGFDDVSSELESWKAKNKAIWEILGLNDKTNDTKINKLNSEIDKLAKWFYYENKSIPEDYEEEKQGKLI